MPVATGAGGAHAGPARQVLATKPAGLRAARTAPCRAGCAKECNSWNAVGPGKVHQPAVVAYHQLKLADDGQGFGNVGAANQIDGIAAKCRCNGPAAGACVVGSHHHNLRSEPFDKQSAKRNVLFGWPLFCWPPSGGIQANQRALVASGPKQGVRTLSKPITYREIEAGNGPQPQPLCGLAIPLQRRARGEAVERAPGGGAKQPGKRTGGTQPLKIQKQGNITQLAGQANNRTEPREWRLAVGKTMHSIHRRKRREQRAICAGGEDLDLSSWIGFAQSGNQRQGDYRIAKRLQPAHHNARNGRIPRELPPNHPFGLEGRGKCVREGHAGLHRYREWTRFFTAANLTIPPPFFRI